MASIDYAQRLYNEGLALFHSGKLEEGRDTLEEALEACAVAPDPSNVQTHIIFTDCLLLLSDIYSAISAFSEAERLLVTCMGYVRDSFASFSQSSSSLARKVRSMENIALATIAYNRGVLVLDECGQNIAVLERGDVEAGEERGRRDMLQKVRGVCLALLGEAEERLKNYVGTSRELLADIWHAKGVAHQFLGENEEALIFFQKSLELRQCFCSSERDQNTECDLKLALTIEHVVQAYRVWLPTAASRHVTGLSVTPFTLQQLLHTVSEVRRRCLGAGHPLLLRSMFMEGVIAAEQGRRSVAAQHLEQCLNAISSIEQHHTSVSGTLQLALPSKKEVERWLTAVTSVQ